MKTIILSLFLLLLNCSQLLAQDIQKANKFYEQGLKLYNKKQVTAAAVEFEKAIALHPKHKDAMFNLAVIHFDLGNTDKAGALFQACAKLGDSDAAAILKEKLHQEVAFADTMHFNVVDVAPKVQVNDLLEDAIVGQGLNKSIEASLIKAFEKSDLLQTQIGPGKFMALLLYFGKDGSLNGTIETSIKTEAIQAEITTILRQAIITVPGKHAGKDIVVTGLLLPVRF